VIVKQPCGEAANLGCVHDAPSATRCSTGLQWYSRMGRDVVLCNQVGIASNSCREDEALLRQVRCAQQYIKAHMASAVVSSETADVMTTPSTRRRGASTSGGAPPQMLIADCRPRANAVVRGRCCTVCWWMFCVVLCLGSHECGAGQANKAAGMGYTSYKSTPLVFLGIHNIHVVRERCDRSARVVGSCLPHACMRTSHGRSHKKLMTVCKSPPSSAFLSDVEDSGWLQHLRSILEGASRVATAVHRCPICRAVVVTVPFHSWFLMFAEVCLC